MKQMFILMILAFFFVGCSNIKVDIDAKKDYDFAPWSTFYLSYEKKDDQNGFFRNRVEMVLADYFTDKGYSSSYKASADFYVQFQYSIETKTIEIQETRVQRPIIYLRGMSNRVYNLSDTCNSKDLNRLMLSGLALAEYIKPIDTIVSTSKNEYKYAKLFIELIDAQTKKVIWQGLVNDDLADISDYKEIEEIINKIFNDFPKKKGAM